jgi:ferritin-like metal-binding protein YciE
VRQKGNAGCCGAGVEYALMRGFLATVLGYMPFFGASIAVSVLAISIPAERVTKVARIGRKPSFKFQRTFIPSRKHGAFALCGRGCLVFYQTDSPLHQKFTPFLPEANGRGRIVLKVAAEAFLRRAKKPGRKCAGLENLGENSMTTKTASEKKTDKTLHDLFMTELADVYSMEKQLVKALPKMAKAATAEELVEALTLHLKETEGHVQTVELVFAAFDMKPKAKKCEAMEGLLSEGDELAASFKGSPACDAAIISACQKVEHYEIASYGCLKEWADLLGNVEASTMLEEILADEKAADDKLSALAQELSNDMALEEHAGASAKTSAKRNNQ